MGLKIYHKIFLDISIWMWKYLRIFCRKISVPLNVVMVLSNVMLYSSYMSLFYIRGSHWVGLNPTYIKTYVLYKNIRNLMDAYNWIHLSSSFGWDSLRNLQAKRYPRVFVFSISSRSFLHKEVSYTQVHK